MLTIFIMPLFASFGVVQTLELKILSCLHLLGSWDYSRASISGSYSLFTVISSYFCVYTHLRTIFLRAGVCARHSAPGEAVDN